MYKKREHESYAIGVFPALELCAAHPEAVTRIVLHPRGQANEGVAKLRAFAAERSLPCEESAKEIERLGGENAYALSYFAKYAAPLAVGANHLVLHQPSDMGNLGTIARTALGFGLRDLAIISPAADAFHPKALRASMGALFHLNVEYFPSIEAYASRHANHRYAFMLGQSRRLSEVRFQAPYALIFGNEGAGLPADFASKATAVTIPHGQEIDSLNLAIAVGIGLYAASVGPS